VAHSFEQVKADANEYKKKVLELEETLSLKNDEIETLHNKIESQNESYKIKLDNLRNTFKYKLKEEKDALDQKFVQQENQFQQKFIEQKQQFKEKAQKQGDEFKERLKKLKTPIEQITSQIENNFKEKEKSIIADFQTQILEKDGQIECSENKITELQSMNQNWKSEIEKMQGIIINLENDNKASLIQINNLKENKKNKAQNEISELKDQLKKEKEFLKKKEEAWIQIEKNVNNKLLHGENLNSQIMSNVKNMRNDLQECNQNLKTQENEISVLKNQLVKEKENSKKKDFELSHKEHKIKCESLKIEKFYKDKFDSASAGFMQLNEHLKAQLKYERAEVVECEQKLEAKVNELKVFENKTKDTISQIGKKLAQFTEKCLNYEKQKLENQEIEESEPVFESWNEYSEICDFEAKGSLGSNLL